MIQLTAKNHLNTTHVPIQRGPVYHCFHCGQQAKRLDIYAELPKLSGYSALDEWGAHIAYLICDCSHNHRVAKLGDCITPLAFPQREQINSQGEFVTAEVTALQTALAAIASAIPEQRRIADTPTRVVMRLLAGLLPPAMAIEQIRSLVAGGQATHQKEQR